MHIVCFVFCFIYYYAPALGGIKRWCASDVWRLSVCLSVGRVHREYSWRPQPLEARRAGRPRPGVRLVWAGAGLQRAAYLAGAYRAASRTACLNCISFAIGLSGRKVAIKLIDWWLNYTALYYHSTTYLALQPFACLLSMAALWPKQIRTPWVKKTGHPTFCR